MEWQEARQWMIQAKTFPPGHPGVRPDAGLDDFANCLRDGVFLCQLLNKIIPDAVQHFHPRATLEFKCIQNINSFLLSVSVAFGIQDEDLFQPNDLFELTNFSAVVKCLSALSRTEAAMALGLEPFPRGAGSVDLNQSVEEDIYGDLENVALTIKATGSSRQPGDETDYGEAENMVPEEELVYSSEQMDEDIYGSLVNFSKTAQETAKGGGFAGLPEKLGHIVAELVETEKSYVDVLNILSEHYINPLTNLLDEKSRDVIFINLPELREVHTGFLTMLEAQVESGAQLISKCFLKHADDFVNYGTYCAGLPPSQTKVQELMDRPDMAKTLDACKKASKQRFNLKELLSVPMQRVLKYPLLLRELIKQGGKCGYGDISGLEEASDALKDVAKSVNEIKRDIEALSTTREIQASLLDYKGENLSTYGRSLLDGEVRIKNVEDPKPKSRYAFLFDKVLIICKNKGDRFTFKKILKLDEYGFEDMQQSAVKGKFSFAFQIQGRTSTAATNSCLFYAKTAQAKVEWLKLVNNAVSNINKTGPSASGHNFDLTTFDCQTQRCSVCRRLMWGLILQGYRCSVCENAVHGDCLTNITARCHGQAQGGQSSAHLSAGGPNVRNTVSRAKDRWMSSTLSPEARRAGGGNRGIVQAMQNYQGLPPPTGSLPALMFQPGDEIDAFITSADFWEGTNTRTGLTGSFPAAFTKRKLEELASPSAPARTRGQKTSYENTELKFNSGNRGGGAVSEKRSLPLPPTPALPGSPGSPSLPPSSPRGKSLTSYSWYVGKMSRQGADSSLLYSANGVFLVRESEARPGTYALSIKYNAGKHIKIVGQDGKVYLSAAKRFSDIPEMIHYYKTSTLVHSFPGLNTTLLQSFGDTTSKCIAQYDFKARTEHELSIEEECEILIISKTTATAGWWYGSRNGCKFGLFPSNYIEEIGS
ncbi:proto-oncogene vav-like [Sycon ciliatum]|uniref:proto-oncogene vav-like n=1 Tax=Sycon ciliatum TaxID=27933 RepID=UPI0020AE45D3|eukprot:scpid28163/ scgid2335/ Guanine nucleotide exchange factor VAV2